MANIRKIPAIKYAEAWIMIQAVFMSASSKKGRKEVSRASGCLVKSLIYF